MAITDRATSLLVDEENPVLKADLRKEYVAGGTLRWASDRFFQALPDYIDDVTADFGADLYDRMMLDAQVSAGVNYLKMAILAQGIKLVNPFNQDDPKYDKAKEILDFCQANLDRLPHSIEDISWEMLDALPYGYKIAEKVFELSKEDPYPRKLMLKDIKVKPRHTVAFVVDGYMNVKGILGLPPNFGTGNAAQVGVIALTGEKNLAANVLPADKFVIFTPRMKDNDPRGQSIIRPAYNAWWIKNQIWPEYLKYLSQFAGPTLVGVTAEGAEPQPATDSNGNRINDTIITPEEVLLATLLKARNGTAIAVPFGSTVDALQVEGDGSAFHTAIDLLNAEITKAILYQTLATGEGQFMARAAASTHQDVLDVLIRHGKRAIAACWQKGVLEHLVRLNFGSDFVEDYTPLVHLPETEIQDFPNNANAIAALQSVKYFPDAMMPEVDAKLGFKPRDLKSWKQEQMDAMQQQMDMQTQMAQMKVTGGMPSNKANLPGGKSKVPGGKIPTQTDPGSRAKVGGD